MMAVLDDAVRCVENHRFSRETRRRRLFADAKQWLLAEEAHWPYSFESICAVLDLDANAVRQRLLLALEQPPGAVSRERQTRRRRTAVNGGHTDSLRNDVQLAFR
jgi:hypothetical protein